MARTRWTAVVVSVLVLIGSVGSGSSGASTVVAKKPCDLVSEKAVRKAFGTNFDLKTNGRSVLKSTCSFYVTAADPCAEAINVFVTVKRYKSNAAAAGAYLELAGANQSLPAQPAEEISEPLARQDLAGIGDGAYSSNARGGWVVVLDGKRILGLGGGVLAGSPGLAGCPGPEDVAAENLVKLTDLAMRLAG